ncbi:MAG: branched-chain amino acid transport system substrate-binding protein, partial [Acidimicrobiaceae bacterium]
MQGINTVGHHNPRRVGPLWWLAIASLVAVACSNKTLPHAATVRTGPSEQLQNDTAAGGAAQGSANAAGSEASGAARSPGAAAGGVDPSPGGANGETAADGGSSVGVTDNSIKISVSGVFSGVGGPIGNDIYDKAAVIWQKQVNANGGIYGRKITLAKVDNQGTADGAIAACKEVASNGSFMVWNMEGAVSAEDDCENAAGIPVLDANPPFMDPSWQTVLAINLSTSFVPAEVSFLKSDYMQAGGNKIGIVYAGDKEGYVLWYEATAAELKAQGMSLVHSEKIVSNQASYVSEMSRMKASGAQTVMLYVTADAPLIIGNARAVDYSPQWYGGTAEGTVSDTFAQAAGPEFQGVYGTRFWTTTESEAYARYLSIVRQYGG